MMPRPACFILPFLRQRELKHAKVSEFEPLRHGRLHTNHTNHRYQLEQASFTFLKLKGTIWVLASPHQLDVKFKKNTAYFEHLTSKQDTETDSLISKDFTLEVVF